MLAPHVGAETSGVRLVNGAITLCESIEYLNPLLVHAIVLAGCSKKSQSVATS